MKHKLSVSLIILALLCCFGCSRIVQSKDVINGIHTRADLIKQMGEPNEKNPHPGFEEWVYFRDTIEAYNRAPIVDTVKQSIQPTATTETQTKPVKQHNADIRFLVDTNNNVVGHKNNGVDLTKKVQMGFGESVLEVLAGTLAVIIIVAVEVINNKLNM